MSNILIAGCGYVGTALARLLSSDKHTVWGLRRRIELLPECIRPIKADLTNSRSLSQIPENLDFIFYTASPDTRSDYGYEMAYVIGVVELIQTLKSQRQCPKRIFFTSSTTVYSQMNGEWVDESSPTDASHFMGNRLLQAESLLNESSFPTTIVRFAGIYGPGRTGLLREAQGSALLPTSSQFYTNRIHRDDCAGVLKHLMELPAPDNLYLGVDEEPILQSDLLQWLSNRLGIMAHQSNVVKTRQSRSNKRCCNGRLLSSGYRFKYPTFREGYLALIGGASD